MRVWFSPHAPFWVDSAGGDVDVGKKAVDSLYDYVYAPSRKP